MKFIQIIEMLGVMSFAFSGALAAMQKKLDVFGVLVLTFVTAVGGGTLRDVIIGSLPVAWLLDLEVIYTLLAAFVIILFFRKYIRRLPHTLFWLDTVGLALFCVVAIGKGLQFNLHPVICVALGTITGSFGGIIRDVLLNEIPYVFRRDVYASACIAGGIVYFIALRISPDQDWASLWAGLVIMLIRVGARYLNWSMPDIYKRSS